MPAINSITKYTEWCITALSGENVNEDKLIQFKFVLLNISSGYKPALFVMQVRFELTTVCLTLASSFSCITS